MSPGRPPSRCEAEPGHCITCGDEGVLMRVLRVNRPSSLAFCVKPDGEPWDSEEVAIDLVEPVLPGQTLLVHAGVALANLDQSDAVPASLAVSEESIERRPGSPRPLAPTGREGP